MDVEGWNRNYLTIDSSGINLRVSPKLDLMDGLNKMIGKEGYSRASAAGQPILGQPPRFFDCNFIESFDDVNRESILRIETNLIYAHLTRMEVSKL